MNRKLLFPIWPLLASLLAACGTDTAAWRLPAAPTPLPHGAITSLPESQWLPDGPPRANIIALHSFGDYRAAFAALGPRLADRGYAVYAFDQRGFGHTAHHGHWQGTEPMTDDVVDAIRRLRQESGAPIYLLGESMGGAVAMVTAARFPQLDVDGLILASPAVREGIGIRYLYNAGLVVVQAVAPEATATVERKPDDPTLRPASARRLAGDPLVIRHVRMDTYWGLIRLADHASDLAPRLRRMPVLLFYGGKDTSVPAVSIRHLRSHLAQVQYHYYPQAPHLLLQGHHWQQYADDIDHWLSRQLDPQEQWPEKPAIAANRK